MKNFFLFLLLLSFIAFEISAQAFPYLDLRLALASTFDFNVFSKSFFFAISI